MSSLGRISSSYFRLILNQQNKTLLRKFQLNKINFQIEEKCRYATAATTEIKKPEIIPDVEKIKVSAAVGQEKDFDGKLVKIVNDISKLTLIEVADLNQLLKKTLNIPDVPMGFGGGFAPPPPKDEEEEAPKQVQTSFTIKLLKFDDGKKVAIIKEIKNLIDGMNLVQSKKFVESSSSAPVIVKSDITKEEAEKIQEQLQAVGGQCEIV